MIFSLTADYADSRRLIKSERSTMLVRISDFLNHRDHKGHRDKIADSLCFKLSAFSFELI